MSPVAHADQQVLIETSAGAIRLALNPEAAPKTVANFLAYVDDSYYEGTIFHRVIKGFMIQGGGHTADYARKQTRDPVANEADNGLKNERGTIAMARTGDPHSATAQFFINHGDNPSLDHRSPTPHGWGYTVFGRVVDGMDVVDAIAARPTGPAGPFRSDVPQEMVTIQRITRVTESPE